MNIIEEYFKPDFEYWKKMDLWNYEEAIFLLISVNPKLGSVLRSWAEDRNFQMPRILEWEDKDEVINYAQDKINEFEKILKLNRKSYYAQDEKDDLLENYQPYPEKYGPSFRSHLFLIWAKKKKLRIPEELRDMLQVEDLLTWGVIDAEDLKHLLGKPDYHFWKVIAHWSLKESVYLAIDADPSEDFFEVEKKRDPSIWSRQFDPESKILLRDAKKNYQKIYELALRDLNSGRMGEGNDAQKINPCDFVKWANIKGLSMPEPLLTLLEEDKSLDARMPLITVDNPNYSLELDVAMLAWKALYVDGGYNPRRSHKEQIRDWLKKNHRELSKGQIERIATVVNPNKRGGAPSQD